MPNRTWRPLVAAGIVLSCVLGGPRSPSAGAAADAAEDTENLPVAPDGVKYLNRDSYEAMQQKSLGNAVKNGSFEEGRYWPYGWDPCDKLGTLWVAGGSDGKRCIRMDTNLIEDQWLPWKEKVLKIADEASKRTNGSPQSLPEDPVPPPPARLPTKPPYYDTAGGNHGIHYRTEFIKLAPGAIYRLSVDARTQCGGAPMVFVKGFFDQRRKMEEGEVVLKREIYRVETTLSGCDAQWRRFARIFHPARSTSTLAAKPIQPEWLRIELYAYWPVGIYEWDNVKLDIIGYEEPAHGTVGPGPETKEPQPATPPAKDGEFPVVGK